MRSVQVQVQGSATVDIQQVTKHADRLFFMLPTSALLVRLCCIQRGKRPTPLPCKKQVRLPQFRHELPILNLDSPAAANNSVRQIPDNSSSSRSPTLTAIRLSQSLPPSAPLSPPATLPPPSCCLPPTHRRKVSNL
eukprot:768587-Hanusia_phi.AAC.4